MTEQEILEVVNKKTSVHQLTFGSFIQEPIRLSENLIAVPLKSIGFKAQAEYLGVYASQISNISVDPEKLNELIKQGQSALPVVSIVKILPTDDSPENLERIASSELTVANDIISWTSGDKLEVFGILIKTSNESFFRIIPTPARTRVRLGFGNTGDAFSEQVKRLWHAAQNDEQFGFALSSLFYANNENNARFRIARYFSCLESLAYKIKPKINGSRKAIKYLLGLEEGAMSEVSIGDKKYRYDVIEIAGRVRDKLFHGVPFRREDLNAENRHVYDLYEQHPGQIASTMQSYCELEIARWSNGSSRGLKEP